jgi:RNA polymerase sigma-70 factor (ECF subfamily)
MSGPGGREASNEAAWLDAARTGDMVALQRLFESYHGMVVGVCAGVLGRSPLLADAVQEVFLKLALSVRQVRDPRRLGPWLGRVARNTAIDLLHAERRDAPGRPSVPEPGPLDALVRDEEQRAVLDAVMKLRPEYREVILLRYLHSNSYREIADTLGLPVSTIETRLHRARKTLAGLMGVRHDDL